MCICYSLRNINYSDLGRGLRVARVIFMNKARDLPKSHLYVPSLKKIYVLPDIDHWSRVQEARQCFFETHRCPEQNYICLVSPDYEYMILVFVLNNNSIRSIKDDSSRFSPNCHCKKNTCILCYIWV